MRLTNFDRDAFINAVMDDVPSIDYQTQADKLARDGLEQSLPDDLLAVIKKYPQHFDVERVGTPHPLNSVAVRGPFKYESLEKLPKLEAEIKKLATKAQAQKEARRDLRSKIHGAIYGCTTLKAAQERLPEFVKYLPQDRDGKITANLPAVANLVADLTKAGWPKGKK